MLKSILLSALSACFLLQVSAQNLYMPREIQTAYKKGTRSMDGKPGKNYWQNFGRYNITITAQPPDRNITGTEQITYVNNSPDTLKGLNMKLILNIHRPGAVRATPASDEYLTSGVQVDTIIINGRAVKWDNKAAGGTNQGVRLPQPLMPHDSVKLDINWHYQISLESNREGMIDPSTYYFAYFYPRISVYDDYTYRGWDRVDFTDEQEFYNDFNDYTLNVKVPKNFLVWSTGTLQNADQVLQPEYLKRLKASMTSDSTIHIADANDIAKKAITAQKDWNTWVWKANHITDVAFGISDHYDWDAASVVVDDATHRRASMQAAFADNATDFKHSVQFGRNALSWLSHNWPGIPYPFPKMTAFQGFADMEYPMMVNDSRQDDIRFAQFVQDHEIAHTYFPFYMGINETRYGFMDEGWATTFELLIGRAEVGAEKADEAYKGFRIRDWINDPATAEDMPIITLTSEEHFAYGNNAYGKPSLSYLALKDMLGDAVFKKALHTYMNNWNGKHPIPWDYFNSMNSGSGKDLNWFFNNWFFTNGYIDLAVDGVAKSSGGYTANIKNIGGLVAPFDLILTYADGTTETLHQTPSVWEANQKETKIAIKTGKTLSGAVIEGGIFMDADLSNNKWSGK